MDDGKQTLERIENMSETPRADWNAQENELAGMLVNMSIKDPLDYTPKEINMLDNMLEAKGEQPVTAISIANAVMDEEQNFKEFVSRLITAIIDKIFGEKTMVVDGAEFRPLMPEKPNTNNLAEPEFGSPQTYAFDAFKGMTQNLDLSTTPTASPAVKPAKSGMEFEK